MLSQYPHAHLCTHLLVWGFLCLWCRYAASPARVAPPSISFKVALNDPMLLITFASFLDRAFATGRPLFPSGGGPGGATQVTSAHLMFWLHCDRVLQIVAASTDVSAALFAARTELAALLQLYVCSHTRVEPCT